MKKSYTSACEHASVQLANYGEYCEVFNVFTDKEFRGRGLQRELWGELLADADAENMVLMLNVGVGARSGLQHWQLREWYERLGFDFFGGTRMVREPGASALLELLEDLRTGNVTERAEG